MTQMLYFEMKKENKDLKKVITLIMNATNMF